MPTQSGRTSVELITIQKRAEELEPLLFGDPSQKSFAILDGARIPNLLDKLAELHPEYSCLYAGELAPDMAEVAPYLVRLLQDDLFTHWVLVEGSGKSWGIFVTSNADIYDLQRHFRRFLMVKDEGGRELYFRYYDPLVLSIYLPTCTPEELTQVFGPICQIVCEAEASRDFTAYIRST